MLDNKVLRLIAITDGLERGRASLVTRVVDAAEGGATCIQLRLKDSPARELAEIAREILSRISIPLIINDRPDVAIAVGAGGCHLGSDDMPAAQVRKIAPAHFIIGCSVGSEAEIASAEGADYAGIGPVFRTTTKLDAGHALGVDGFRNLMGKLKIPAIGIGGITSDNAGEVIAAGATGVAVVSAIFGANDVRSASASLAHATGS